MDNKILENFLQTVEQRETISETLDSLDLLSENDSVSHKDTDDIAKQYLNNTL